MLSRRTPDLILDSRRSTMPSLLSRRTPDLIASMLSRGALLQYARFYFFQPTYRCLPWLAWHGWWSRSTSSLSWWACCDDFLLFCVVGLEKSDNATLEKQFRKRSDWQNFCNSFSVQDVIKVQRTNITTRNNGTRNSQLCTQVSDLIKVQQGHHKEQWYYEFPIMYLSFIPEVQQEHLKQKPQRTLVLVPSACSKKNSQKILLRIHTPEVTGSQ